MNWTDDMRRLKEAADDIAEKRGKQLDAPTTIIMRREAKSPINKSVYCRNMPFIARWS